MSDSLTTSGEVLVPMAAHRVSDDPGIRIATSGLGSCVAICLYDSMRGIGGVAHAMLPLSKADAHAEETDPAMYADTASVALRRAMLDLGAEAARLRACLVGGAEMIRTDNESGAFRMGQRNVAVARVMLMELNILMVGEDTGGRMSRSVVLDLKTGEVAVRCGGQRSIIGLRVDGEK